jgi:uncharacterized protein (DUF1697 family)
MARDTSTKTSAPRRSSYIALLRAVNLGGHNRVSMTDLRELLTRLGFEECRSLLQSGNLVFRGPARSPDEIEDMLERDAKRRLDLAVDFFVRTGDEWEALVKRNPFRAEAAREPARLLAMCFKTAPEAAAVKQLQAAISGRECIRVDGRHAYMVYPDGIGRSRLTHTLIERKLAARGTGRNWNTVLKLAALAK